MYDNRISYLCKMFKTKNNPPLYCHGGGDLDFVVTNPKLGGGGPWWGTFGSMRRGGFFHHKIHIKHQDLSQKDGRYDMVMLMTWV